MSTSAHDAAEPDWRRLASDRNIADHVAHQLWQQARAMSPNDMRNAERLFKHLLDEASRSKGATHEPGRETLVDSRGVKDPGSLGPGKTTRVMQEYPSSGPAGTAKQATQPQAKRGPTGKTGKTGKTGNVKPESVTADELHRDLVAAADAYQELIAMLKQSDSATIMEALRELHELEGPDVVQQFIKTAGGVIENIFNQYSPAKQGQPTQAATSIKSDAQFASPQVTNANASLASAQALQASVQLVDFGGVMAGEVSAQKTSRSRTLAICRSPCNRSTSTAAAATSTIRRFRSGHLRCTM